MSPRLIAVALLLFTAPMVQAHEGHGHPEHTEGILHYAVNPSHSVVGLYAAFVITAAIFVARRQFRKRSLKAISKMVDAKTR